MAPELSRAVRRVTFVLLALSAAAVEVAAVDSRPVIQSLGLAALWVAIAAVAAWFVPVPVARYRATPRAVFLLLFGLAVAPFAVEPLRREWTGDGYPLELQMVMALRNVGLGLAACGGWFVCLRMACVVSLFLTLFAVAMTNQPAVLVILGLYTATGSVWLMLAYWTGLKAVLVPPDREVAVEVQARGERLPWVSLFVVLAVVGSVLGLIAVGPQRASRTLGEWIGTSGGTGDYDPFARGGVNDGDDETTGDNAKSTGMTQTDMFLESPLPSLYDLANDMYGPPHKPPKDQESAIALDQSKMKMRQSKKRPPDNLRPNRAFPTARKSNRMPNTPLSRDARAIFEVEGRTPLHIRVVAFDTFDGRDWHEAPVNSGHVLLTKEPSSNWMIVSGKPLSAFAEPEHHQFKITAPEGAFIPTPAQLTRFRIGMVNQVDFFAWGHDRVLKFAKRKTPSGIVVETECNTVDPSMLDDIEFASCPIAERFDYDTLPPDLHPDIVALARSWTEGKRRGWQQICAVVDRLQSEYILDPAYSAPADCRDPLAHFLLESRRGPDYQFATAAAVLLRVLGYPTRLVNGFYASPDNYDPETKHTPVVKQDMHFWPEVMLPGGDWLVIEPTPGYEVLGPNLPFSERLLRSLLAATAWAGRHALELGIALAMLVLVWVCRRELIDAVAMLLWRWFPGRTWRDQIRLTVTLLERRGRWVGRSRGLGQTVAAWLRLAVPEIADRDPELTQLTHLAEWAAYSPENTPPYSPDDPLAVCRQVLTTWTLRRWRVEARSETPTRVRL